MGVPSNFAQQVTPLSPLGFHSWHGVEGAHVAGETKPGMAVGRKNGLFRLRGSGIAEGTDGNAEGIRVILRRKHDFRCI